MRKLYKTKMRSCGLCKPHKQGWENRWKLKHRHLIERTEQEMRMVVGSHDPRSLAVS